MTLSDREGDRSSRMAMRLLFAAALLVSLLVLASSWHLPILEMHSFRQTQTAISSYWMSTTSNWLAYPTPVLGYPWALPFEFPFFQAVVLAATSALPINLDQAGRLVSWLFALATLWPLRVALIEVTGRRNLADAACVLFLLSPLYLFWSRAFLIESTALFFAVSFVALLSVYLRRQSALLALAMILCACMAALVKITTFFGFALAAAFLMLAHLVWTRGSWSLRAFVRLYAPAVIAVLAAVVLTAIWVKFSDVEKAKTVMGSALSSGNLTDWNFGQWGQRLQGSLWAEVIFGRSARDLLGFAWVFPLAGVFALLAPRGNRGFALAMVALYLAPFLVFANVHIVHNYYQYANGIFLVVLLACGLEALGTVAGERMRLAGLVLAGVMMLIGFRRDFLPAITGPLPATGTLELAAYARAHTSPDDVLLVFGADWSSEIPYYATRRAMMVPDWMGVELLNRMRLDQRAFTGGLNLGLVIACPNKLAEQPAKAAEFKLLFSAVTSGKTPTMVHGCAIYQ